MTSAKHDGGFPPHLPSKPFEPASEMVISDLETLRVLADPLRLSILEYLMKPGTVKRIAEKIDKPPTKLYYHFNLLEKHQLIQMVDTRVVSGIIEKHYQASAKVYRVDAHLLTPGADSFEEGLELTLGSLFADTKNEITASLRERAIDPEAEQDEQRDYVVAQARMHLTNAQFREFNKRMYALVKEFEGTISRANEGNPDAHLYKLLHVFYRSTRELGGGHEQNGSGD